MRAFKLMAAQNDENAENILAVETGRGASLSDASRTDCLFTLTAGAEPKPSATESEQILKAKIEATHPDKTFAQVTILEIARQGIADNQPEIAARLGEPLFAMLFETVAMFVEQLPEKRLLRFARMIDARSVVGAWRLPE